MKASFITFEGIDASGKSTQIRLLEDYLRQQGKPVLTLRDPGSSRISEQIRKILLDTENVEMSAATELLLYEAARAQMVEQFIRPALLENTIVLCDRFYDSTTAYQGYGRELDLEMINAANMIGACGLVPDKTFFIDLEPQQALHRRQKNNLDSDRLENENSVFYNRVRDGYLKIADLEPERVVRIDGNQAIETIHKQVLDHFQMMR